MIDGQNKQVEGTNAVCPMNLWFRRNDHSLWQSCAVITSFLKHSS